MTELVVCLSTGKGTWQHVFRLIKEQDWEKVFVITSEFFKDKIDMSEMLRISEHAQEHAPPFRAAVLDKIDKIETIVVDPDRFLTELTEEIRNKLNGKIKGTEVAINFISGSGKEHMAILSALLKLGLGVRLVALTKDGVKEV